MLWLAIRLPLLALEICPQQPPSAVIAKECIVVCDTLAAHGGIVPGMRLADAWGLLPELTVRPRDAAREARQLEALACWAGRFTSEVCLSPPTALLLEVQGSLRLFGGLEALLAQLRAGITEQGHLACIALAPTPRAALWLAAGNHGAEVPCCYSLEAMRERLACLPLQILELPPAQERRVAGFGVRSVGDLLRLPRAGLVRRLGAGFGTQLAQALGELPDPQPRFRFPETFRAHLELAARVDDAARLLFAARRLVAMLCGWLAARSSGVAVCRLLLEHETKETSTIELVFSAVTRDAERIVRVLRERLERLVLESPVEAIALLAEAPEALPGREGSLFAGVSGVGGVSGGLGAEAAAENVAQLVERLQARLGSESVHGLSALAEHRPEDASRLVSPGCGQEVPVAGPRPTWLLPRPKPLPEINGRPQHSGPLTLLAGPERIESGWWDAEEAGATGDIRRDYFVALSSRHEWLWVYRSPGGWFLHGFFA
jgi:protein ImuB